MTDDDIIKLAQQFNVRKTLAEVAAETVSYRFDALGFARAVLAAATPAPTAPSDRERRWAKHLAKDESSDLACAECYPHGHLLKSGYKCIRHDAIALLATPAPTAPSEADK